MQLRVLSEQDVRSVLRMADAIDIQAEAFTTLADGRSIEGLRSFAKSESPPGVAIFNPSFLTGGKGYGLKVVSDFYENEQRNIPRMSALVALFDGMTGRPRTVMEAGYLTDIRTGAGTALVARYLARKNSRVIGVFGAGRVARNQLEALCVELDIERVYVCTRSRGRGEEFVNRMRAAGNGVPSKIELSDDRAAVAATSDIVVCATTSHEPVFPGSELRAGTFVVGAGAYASDMREVDSETIKRATKHIIDSKRDCLEDAGDFLIPARKDGFDTGRVADIADLVGGRAKGREFENEITFFKSMGVPIQDLITAQYVERRATEEDIGVKLDIGGDQD